MAEIYQLSNKNRKLKKKKQKQEKGGILKSGGISCYRGRGSDGYGDDIDGYGDEDEDYGGCHPGSDGQDDFDSSIAFMISIGWLHEAEVPFRPPRPVGLNRKKHPKHGL
eukprot:TRINITY_DN10552_c0_g2_i1.p1 TRINITY_DN10552_c0_g2~~TRINITY_DN10552_c0_g2_i1.p1  ORF type:complete len:124 (-),score=32.81 TRINITY_DN10552_c0_g2_i1:436-762(-)